MVHHAVDVFLDHLRRALVETRGERGVGIHELVYAVDGDDGNRRGFRYDDHPDGCGAKVEE